MIEFSGCLIPLWLMIVMWVGILGIFVISLLQYYRDSKEFWKSLEKDDKEGDLNED